MASVTVINEESFDGQPAWRMTGPDGSAALIAARGATLLSWEPVSGAEIIALQAAEQFVLYTGIRPTEDQLARAGAFSRAG